MYRKLGTIVVLALALSGCASSPFYVDKKSSYAPGFIPRNELGQPVFPKSKAKAKARPEAKETRQAEEQANAATAVASPLPAPKAAARNSWLRKG